MIDQHSSPEEKIALFRSLFRGNHEMYPRKFVNRKTGEEGFAPACGNEWVPGICEKPKVKCRDCRHQRFYPVTDEVVRWHLQGYDYAGREFVMALYPALMDESCFLVMFECDKEGWQEDALAFLKICRRLDLPASLERVHSGKSARVWLFFAEAIPLALARSLASHIVTEAMDSRPEIGLESYNKLIPRQDTIVKGGFGDFLFLPLERKARELGK